MVSAGQSGHPCIAVSSSKRSPKISPRTPVLLPISGSHGFAGRHQTHICSSPWRKHPRTCGVPATQTWTTCTWEAEVQNVLASSVHQPRSHSSRPPSTRCSTSCRSSRSGGCRKKKSTSSFQTVLAGLPATAPSALTASSDIMHGDHHVWLLSAANIGKLRLCNPRNRYWKVANTSEHPAATSPSSLVQFVLIELTNSMHGGRCARHSLESLGQRSN